jgi:hypothetical protein
MCRKKNPREAGLELTGSVDGCVAEVVYDHLRFMGKPIMVPQPDGAVKLGAGAD